MKKLTIIILVLFAAVMISGCEGKENQKRVEHFPAKILADPVGDKVSFSRSDGVYCINEASVKGTKIRQNSDVQIKETKAIFKRYKEWEIVGVIKY